MSSPEVQEDPPPQKELPTKASSKSYAEAAQRKQGLQQYEFDIAILDGKKLVEVPSEIVEKSNPLWDDFVIISFLEDAPHIAKVHMILNKIWSYGDKNQKL